VYRVQALAKHAKLLIVLKDFLAFLFRHTPRRVRLLLTRFGNSRFIVSAGAVIVNEQGQVLLLKHVFRTGSGWGIPGGFVNTEEQPEAALRRELREEVGLELSRVEIALARSFRHRQVELIYRCQPNGEAQPRGLEIKSAAWFAPADLPEELSTDQRELILRVLNDGAKTRN
jgi:mutator protein MutT